MSFESQYVTSY